MGPKACTRALQLRQQLGLDLRIGPLGGQIGGENDLFHLAVYGAKGVHSGGAKQTVGLRTIKIVRVRHGIHAHRLQIKGGGAGLLLQFPPGRIQDRLTRLSMTAGHLQGGASLVLAKDPLALCAGGDHGEFQLFIFHLVIEFYDHGLPPCWGE